MDMNSTSSTGSTDMSNMPVMKMYFHFTGGDYVLFEKWQPMSHAGIAGASIALFAIAVFERLLGGARRQVEQNWNKRFGSSCSLFQCLNFLKE
jgi:copper transporter 1